MAYSFSKMELNHCTDRSRHRECVDSLPTDCKAVVGLNKVVLEFVSKLICTIMSIDSAPPVRAFLEVKSCSNQSRLSERIGTDSHNSERRRRSPQKPQFV